VVKKVYATTTEQLINGTDGVITSKDSAFFRSQINMTPQIQVSNHNLPRLLLGLSAPLHQLLRNIINFELSHAHFYH
jgi:hypothetical protein